MLSFHELREANVTRCHQSYHPVKDWSPIEWLMCVTGEIGEVAHLLKEEKRQGEDFTHPDTLTEIAYELADVAIYLDLLAASLDIDLGEAVARKFNITSRKRGSRVFLNETK